MISTPIFTQRVALVIGNSNYQGSRLAKLKNPGNDADLMESSLKQVGFEVIKLKDAGSSDLEEGLKRFSQKVKKGDVALVYYAGTGMLRNGVNYLIPVDADLDNEDYLHLSCLALDKVLSVLSEATTKILFIDACMPELSGNSLTSPTVVGMNNSEALKNSFIGFASLPGQAASDGSGQNSPFAQALAKNITLPGVEIASVFYKVISECYQASDGLSINQRPYHISSLLEAFYFVPRSAR